MSEPLIMRRARQREQLIPHCCSSPDWRKRQHPSGYRVSPPDGSPKPRSSRKSTAWRAGKRLLSHWAAFSRRRARLRPRF